jgi:translation initiation factor 1 (eIF-1/SUI1)
MFETQRTSLLNAAFNEADQQKKLRILVDGVKRNFAVKITTRKGRRGGVGRIISGSTTDPHLEVLLKNLERFLAQAQYDPSVSSKLLQDWERSLLQELDLQALKYQYATLYGELVTEWLSSEKPSAPVEDAMDEGFEHIRLETQAKDEGRKNWEHVVFEPFETDQASIAQYLRGLFGNNGTNRQAIKALYALRKSVQTFEYNFSVPGQFNEEVLRWTIDGLLASGLLSEEKRAALKDFLLSPVILVEVADVLNLRMASIDSWSWDLEGTFSISQ